MPATSVKPSTRAFRDRSTASGMTKACRSGVLRPSTSSAAERAEDPEEDGLGKPLANESSAAGANRDPDRDLALPRHRATEQQACDIHARHHEHHQHHTRQLPQQRPRRHAKAAALAERRHGERPVAIGVRIGRLQLAGHDFARATPPGRWSRQPAAGRPDSALANAAGRRSPHDRAPAAQPPPADRLRAAAPLEPTRPARRPVPDLRSPAAPHQ